MKVLSADTTPEAQRMHYEMMSHLPAPKRLALAFELTETVRKLILSDLYQRFPRASEEEIRSRFIARVLPRADVIRVYGFDPRQKGY